MGSFNSESKCQDSTFQGKRRLDACLSHSNRAAIHRQVPPRVLIIAASTTAVAQGLHDSITTTHIHKGLLRDSGLKKT